MARTTYVALELGFWDDPIHLSFARAIGEPRTGVHYIARLREFVLAHGKRGHLPARYDGDALTAGLGYQGKTRRFIEAMKRARLLVFRRGRGFSYVDWSQTITGQYELEREADAARKRKERAAGTADRGGASDSSETPSKDVPRTSGGRLTENETSIVSKTTPGVGDPPAGPPPQGGDEGAMRLAWTEENYPLGLRDPALCRGLLAELTHDDWENFRHAVLYEYSKRKTRFVKPAEVVISKHLYRYVKRQKPRSKPPKKERSVVVPQVDLEAEKASSRRRFLEQALSDPELEASKRGEYLTELHRMELEALADPHGGLVALSGGLR